MTAKKILKEAWDKSAFHAHMKKLSPERIAEDNAILQEAFALADEAPAFKEALDWAKAHGLEFIVDRSTAAPGAYYTIGSGVIALGTSRKDDVKSVTALTHEIRHAWQDWHDMIPTSTDSFEELYIKMSLVEADASAHGAMAGHQYFAAVYNSAETLTPEQEKQGTWILFKSWYSDGNPPFYGDWFSTMLGEKLGIEGCVDVSQKLEFKEGPTIPKDGIDIKNIKSIKKLGERFNGTNYMPAQAADFIQKSVLKKSLASTFYGTANDDQKKLVATINKKLNGKKITI